VVGGGVNRHIRGCRIGFGETHLERGKCISKSWGCRSDFSHNLLISALFKGGL